MCADKIATGGVPAGCGSLSFKVTSKSSSRKVATSATSLRSSFNDSTLVNTEDEDKDYILETEGRSFKLSGKSSSSSTKLVIPMIAKNNWNNSEGVDGAEDIDAAAVNEIMKELSESEKSNEADVASIPLMMRNRVPVPKNGEEMNEKYDISLRPEESTAEDYDAVPVSSFGSALLRGMGWSEGGTIGKTNKGICEPIEYIPRHKGLGLGAEKRNEDQKSQRKRKPGDTIVDKHQPVIDEDGRVHHIKKVGEAAEDRSVKSMCIGSCVKILKNPHKGLYGKIVSVDADTARISVSLSISGEVIHVSEHNAELVAGDELKELRTKPQCAGSANPKSQSSSKCQSTKFLNGNASVAKKSKQDSSSEGKPPWMHSDIRVRIISKSFKGGRYYNKKVKILDVTSLDRCMCQTEEKEILNDVRQSYLETVIPKTKGSYVKILVGKYRGQHARLVDRNKSECMASLQLLQSKEIKYLSFDDIAEFTGRSPEDDVL